MEFVFIIILSSVFLTVLFYSSSIKQAHYFVRWFNFKDKLSFGQFKQIPFKINNRNQLFLILISILFVNSSILARKDFEVEIRRGFTTPGHGPKNSSNSASSIYNLTSNFSLTGTIGYSKCEQSYMYLRDEQNTPFKIKSAKNFRIIPLIFGGRYSFERVGILKPFLETDAGLEMTNTFCIKEKIFNILIRTKIYYMKIEEV